jgi:hypothetical protein
MTQWEYTYIWWEGSTTSTANGRLGETTPPIGDEVLDKLNALAADGWDIAHITAVPLTTGWMSPQGRAGTAGITDKVHYLAVLRRAKGNAGHSPSQPVSERTGWQPLKSSPA